MTPDSGGFADVGLLTPVAVGHDAVVSDAAVAAALIEVEAALVRAAVALGLAPGSVGVAVERGADELRRTLDVAALAAEAVGGGNPVIPLVALLRTTVSDLDTDAAGWVHRGATSQDVVDSALALLVARACSAVSVDLGRVIAGLAALAAEHRDTVAVARTLGQHATPTTWGFRIAGWIAAVRAARTELRQACEALPAQLGGASGTLASFTALYGAETAARLPSAFAHELGLAAPELPWHVARRPLTRVGDAFTAVLDALGVIATDVALASRTEVGEAAEPAAPGRGGSSAMPHKRNPVLSVLIRSAALRAPGLAADLHRAAALAADERPDGAWHSEWPALRELLRGALGAAAAAAELAEGLTIDAGRATANLALTGGDVVSEQAKLTGSAGAPADYTGLAGRYVDEVLAAVRQERQQEEQ
ncbi:lyase family protein [Gryllotalpicola koreensis]|uniref:3-carboxy-cis,cis-muconate cycloisomerase n=1 Tax=Gryllotalpicola koreensis TaxID=993086 RepID=A0ABP7ZRM6_9MICO